jgi:hypothetical protein
VAGAHLGQVVRQDIETWGFERVPIEVDLETEFLLDVLADQESEGLAGDNGDLDEAGFSPQESGHTISAVGHETAAVSETESFVLGLGSDVLTQADRLETLHELVVPHVAADRFVTRAVRRSGIRIVDGGDLTRFGLKDVIGDQSVVRVTIARRRVRPTANTSLRQVRT